MSIVNKKISSKLTISIQGSNNSFDSNYHRDKVKRLDTGCKSRNLITCNDIINLIRIKRQDKSIKDVS